MVDQVPTHPASEQDQKQQGLVDESAISGVRPDHARKNSLENHLQHRPERSELVDRNILPASNAAPGLQAQQKELEKHMLENRLNQKLSQRPQPETLIEGGVLKEDPRSPEDKYAEAIEDEYAKREGGA